MTDEEQAALEWIKTVESDKSRVRDGDIYPMLREWVDRNAPSSVLEIGCGQGVCSDKINLEGRTYTGIDRSAVLINRAKQLYSTENRNFILANAYELPFQNASFDAAYSVAVWHLLKNINAATTELSRILKPGAAFLIITADPAAREAWSALGENLHLHELDAMHRALDANSLNIERTITFRQMFVLFEGKRSPSA